jgi:hypothetical protein
MKKLGVLEHQVYAEKNQNQQLLQQVFIIQTVVRKITSTYKRP